MADSVTVGQNGPFGPSNTLLQIWQMLVDARTGAFPLSVTGGGGGGSGFTALTGDVTASGSGSVAATVAAIQGVTITGSASAQSLTWGGATVTTSQPVLNLTQVWNNGAVNFNGILLNITNTAAGSNSMLMNLQVGGTPVFSVGTNQTAYVSGGLVIGSIATQFASFTSNGASWAFAAATVSCGGGDLTLSPAGVVKLAYNATTAVSPIANAYITIKDGTGTTYKVLLST